MFIETPQLTGASCKLTDSKSGEWFLPSTPGSATVQKGNGPMNITCEKEGLRDNDHQRGRKLCRRDAW